MASRQKHGAKVAPAADVALRQADLSHLRVQDMTPEQRAELRRRYDSFVGHFGAAAGAMPSARSKRKTPPRKWAPGVKR